MHTDDPCHDPKPTQVPAPSPPAGPIADWFGRQSPLVRALLVAVITTLVNQFAPWAAPILRPPATAVDPLAPVAVQAAKGEAAAAVLTDIGLLDEQP
jgi:MFS family permease